MPQQQVVETVAPVETQEQADEQGEEAVIDSPVAKTSGIDLDSLDLELDDFDYEPEEIEPRPAAIEADLSAPTEQQPVEAVESEGLEIPRRGTRAGWWAIG